MDATWPSPLRRQAQTLVDQFLLGAGKAWIGIAGIQRLGIGAGRFPETMRLGGRLEALGGRPLSRAFVWVQGTEPELWVDPGAGNWRDLFDDFARRYLSMPGRPDGRVFNIDHVFPKSAAVLDGLTHVRILAIGAAGNQDAGWSLETAMKDRANPKASGKPSRKVIRHATWMSIGKVADFTGWEALPDSDEPAANVPQAAALFAYLAARGIVPPAGDMEQGLTAYTMTHIH